MSEPAELARRPTTAALTLLREADRKRFATLQALAMLKGVTVRVFTNDSERIEFVIAQFAMTAFANTIDDLERQLLRFGVGVAPNHSSRAGSGMGDSVGGDAPTTISSTGNVSTRQVDIGGPAL